MRPDVGIDGVYGFGDLAGGSAGVTHGNYRRGALAGHATVPRSGVQRIYAGTAVAEPVSLDQATCWVFAGSSVSRASSTREASPAVAAAGVPGSIRSGGAFRIAIDCPGLICSLLLMSTVAVCRSHAWSAMPAATAYMAG